MWIRIRSGSTYIVKCAWFHRFPCYRMGSEGRPHCLKGITIYFPDITKSQIVDLCQILSGVFSNQWNANLNKYVKNININTITDAFYFITKTLLSWKKYFFNDDLSSFTHSSTSFICFTVSILSLPSPCLWLPHCSKYGHTLAAALWTFCILS